MTWIARTHHHRLGLTILAAGLILIGTATVVAPLDGPERTTPGAAHIAARFAVHDGDVPKASVIEDKRAMPPETTTAQGIGNDSGSRPFDVAALPPFPGGPAPDTAPAAPLPARPPAAPPRVPVIHADAGFGHTAPTVASSSLFTGWAASGGGFSGGYMSPRGIGASSGFRPHRGGVNVPSRDITRGRRTGPATAAPRGGGRTGGGGRSTNTGHIGGIGTGIRTPVFTSPNSGGGGQSASQGGSPAPAAAAHNTTSAFTVSESFTNVSGFLAPTSPGTFATFTGTVGGYGSFTGNTAFSGVFSPGMSPGLVSMGNVVFDAGNTLLIELGGLVRGTEYDAIDAITVALGGTLDIDLIALVPGDPVFVPQLGDAFDIIIADSITGTFATVLYPALPGGLYLDLSIVQASARAADILRLTVSQGTAVPEPGSLILLGLGLTGLGLIRRRKTA